MPVPAPVSVLCGQIRPLGVKGHSSSIAKVRVQGPWRVTHAGLVGDTQADRKNHGGHEKAIHHYPFDHYGTWRSKIGPHPLLADVGAFGENFSTAGWTEETVHIGDVIKFGTALLQVSQGRQPCWKLNVRFGRDDIAYRTQMSGRTGWYYRVLQEGVAEPDDQLSLVGRPCSRWPLSRLIALLYRDKNRCGELEEMANIPELAPGWRSLASRRLKTQAIEDWAARLCEPQ